MSASSTPTVDQAIRFILQKNFDADSKICFLTLLKIIDNILQKPGNEKVRSLRIGNATIKSKIIDKQGHHVLMACGFVHEPADLKWQTEERLVLKETNEDTQVLIKARHTLARIGTLELGLKSDDIPAYKAPPTIVNNNNKSQPNGFDVYATSRFDGQSASVGTNLGAPKNWKSKTEQELQALQQRQAKLQTKLSTTSSSTDTPDRHWTLVLPGQSQPTITQTPAQATTTKGDASLLASHFKEQHAKRLAADNRGFTTKAMRDLEKLKKQKVYSHTQLAIHFPDGMSLRANFSTRDTIRTVMQNLKSQVLNCPNELELYQTPPRTVLKESESLQTLGLVPAAKVYVSWKRALVKPTGAGTAWYIRPAIVGSAAQSPALPTAVPVVPQTNTVQTTVDAPAKRKMTRAEKEAAMMKRMLGKR